MPTLSLTFSNAIGQRIAAAIGYKATLEDGIQPNPVSAMETLKRIIINDIKERVKNNESAAAAAQAQANASADVETNLTIT